MLEKNTALGRVALSASNGPITSSRCPPARSQVAPPQWHRPNVGQQIAQRTSMKNRARVTIGLLALTACEEASMLPQLQARAALDLDCQPSRISARDLDDRTVIAGGCGKRAIYVLNCTGKYGNHCTWLLNSPIRAANVSAPQKSTQPVR